MTRFYKDYYLYVVKWCRLTLHTSLWHPGMSSVDTPNIQMHLFPESTVSAKHQSISRYCVGQQIPFVLVDSVHDAVTHSFVEHSAGLSLWVQHTCWASLSSNKDTLCCCAGAVSPGAPLERIRHCAASDIKPQPVILRDRHELEWA